MSRATTEALREPSWPRTRTRNRSRDARVARDLILLSAGTAARRETSRSVAQRLIEDVQWPLLIETLRSRALLPVLGPRIVELAADRECVEFSTAVEGSIVAGRRQGALLQLAGQHVGRELADAGVRSTLLKGPQLGELIHGEPGRRLSTDIDLLVPAKQIHVAVEVLRRLGYDQPADQVGDDGLPLLHFALAHRNDELPPVELHWRIHWYEERFAYERLLPPEGTAVSDWRPAPADELASLLLFYARDGFVDLRLATDLSAWWDLFGPDMSSERLDGLLDRYPRLAPAIPVSIKVAEKVVGLPSKEILRDMPGMGLRARLAVRMADPNPNTSSAQLYADMGFID